jgi:methyl-accepting chemotaxis protein WspA
MTLLRDVTIRAKLYALTLFSVIGLSLVLGLSLWVLYQYRINGPVYDPIARRAAALGEVEPATFYVARPFLALAMMTTTTDLAELSFLRENYVGLEQHFRERESYWMANLPEGPLKAALVGEVLPLGNDFYKVANAEYLPLVGKEKPEQLTKVLNEKLKPRFLSQREAIKRAVQTGKESIKKLEDDAAARIEFWLTTMIIVSVASVLLIGVTSWLVTREIVRPTDALLGRVREMSGGASDLTARVPVESRDELGQLAEGINATIDKIQTIVRRVREASVQLLSTASEIGAAARQQEATVQTLGSSTTEIAASVREITATSKELSGTMNEVSCRADKAAAIADAAQAHLGEMEAAMPQLVSATASVSAKLGEIREKADGINLVVTTITKVADQTNLLSINAAIEAEKAGEYGRGFLVVAREIRRLADQTAVATLDIENMVRHMQDAVSAGVMQMDKFSEEVRSGVARVAELNAQTSQIIEEVHALGKRFQMVNEGVKNQSLGAQQIDVAMTQVSGGAQQTRAALEEFKRATEHLRGSVESLNEEVAQFKV